MRLRMAADDGTRCVRSELVWLRVWFFSSCSLLQLLANFGVFSHAIPFRDFYWIESHDAATGYLYAKTSSSSMATTTLYSNQNNMLGTSSSTRENPINNWVITQTGPLSHQLDCGARGFDLRPMCFFHEDEQFEPTTDHAGGDKSENMDGAPALDKKLAGVRQTDPEIYFHHGLIPVKVVKFEDVLNEVSAWVKNDTETTGNQDPVILDMSHFVSRTASTRSDVQASSVAGADHLAMIAAGKQEDAGRDTLRRQKIIPGTKREHDQRCYEAVKARAVELGYPWFDSCNSSMVNVNANWPGRPDAKPKQSRSGNGGGVKSLADTDVTDVVKTYGRILLLHGAACVDGNYDPGVKCEDWNLQDVHAENQLDSTREKLDDAQRKTFSLGYDCHTDKSVPESRVRVDKKHSSIARRAPTGRAWDTFFSYWDKTEKNVDHKGRYSSDTGGAARHPPARSGFRMLQAHWQYDASSISFAEARFGLDASVLFDNEKSGMNFIAADRVQKNAGARNKAWNIVEVNDVCLDKGQLAKVVRTLNQDAEDRERTNESSSIDMEEVHM
ncbi:unnamed protein product [Amoebophrya sp. A120]|nr:unnamed protein product [Amoebophrya sp. A120]|eukprot:GSA120T00007805001.1